MRLSRRKQLALIILGISILAAIYIAIPGDGAGVREFRAENVRPASAFVRLVDWLNRIKLAHVMGHLLIFGGVALLLGPWEMHGERGDSRLAMRYVIFGGLVMEAAQVAVGYSDDHITDLILGVSLDLTTDVVSALLVLLLLVMLPRYRAITSSK
jgi:hypothetical protein